MLAIIFDIIKFYITWSNIFSYIYEKLIKISDTSVWSFIILFKLLCTSSLDCNNSLVFMIIYSNWHFPQQLGPCQVYTWSNFNVHHCQWIILWNYCNVMINLLPLMVCVSCIWFVCVVVDTTSSACMHIL